MSHYDASNPYASNPQGFEPAPVTGDSEAPRWFGMLNIVFSIMLLMMGLCCGVYAVLFTVSGPMMAQQKAEIDAKLQAKKEEAEQEFADAETDEDRQAAQEELDDLKDVAEVEMPDIGKMVSKTPQIGTYLVGDTVSGLLLNVMMLISGIGLLGYHEWARKLALVTAGLKIVRLVVICIVLVVVIAPLVTDLSNELFGELGKIQEKQGVKPKGFKEVAAAYGMMTTGWGIAQLVLGAIYPLLTLIFLSRANARAACQAARNRSTPSKPYDGSPKPSIA